LIFLSPFTVAAFKEHPLFYQRGAKISAVFFLPNLFEKYFRWIC